MRWLQALLGVLVILGGGATQIYASGSRPWLIALVGGLLAAVGQIALGFIAASRNKSERENTHSTMRGFIGPLASELATMSEDKRKNATRIGVACTQAVTAARDLPRSSGVRASIFAVDEAGQKPAFVPLVGFTVGRDDYPRSRFEDGRDDEGNEVWEVAREGRTVLVKDVKKTPPAGWDPSRKRPYRTFITAPIMAGGRPCGLLTVNSSTPGDLDDADRDAMSVLAGLLSVAYTLNGSKWPDNREGGG